MFRLTKKEITQVEALAAVLTKKQLADYFGVSEVTYAEMEKRQPEARLAYKKGKARAISNVANSLLSKALKGNITAAIFYLKTQAGWREVDRSTAEQAEAADGQPQRLELVVVRNETGNNGTTG